MEHAHEPHLPSGVFGDSLTPFARDRISVETEVARMNRGRGRQIWGLTAGLLALVAIGAVVVRIMDTQELRSTAYATFLRADEEHAQTFLACALPGMDTSRVRSAATLLSMLDVTSQRLGARTASRLGECMPELGVLGAEVQRLRVPDDARDELAELQVALAELTAAFGAYQAFVATKPADQVNALPLMDKAAVAWTTYRARSNALADALLPPE